MTLDYVDEVQKYSDEEVNKIVEAEGFVKKGDMLINLAAMPIIDKGMVNTLRVSLI